VVRRVNDAEELHLSLDDAALERCVDRLRARLAVQGISPQLACETFALIRESARRSLGLRHHDVQLRAGWALLNGRIGEMNTGEGKTLSATLAAATAALAGIPVHVITVNDYLAERDAAKLSALYDRLGISVGVVREGDETDVRRNAYRQPVVYCSNKQLVFDFMQDQLDIARLRGAGGSGATRMKLGRLFRMRRHDDVLMLQGLCFAIVDEADSVLVDEARTPMILARESRDAGRTLLYTQALHFARALDRNRDFLVHAHAHRVELTGHGLRRAAAMCLGAGARWEGARQREQLLTLALTALHTFHLDEHYVIKDERVCIVDAYTGRVLGDRSWEGGLQQMIELKESVPMTPERETMARLSQQRFFAQYLRLGGMTGTGHEVRRELRRVYGLRFERIPTHRPSLRRYHGERLFRDAGAKWAEVLSRVKTLHQQGRPVLVGTRSIRDSEFASGVLAAAGLAHQVLNARQDAEEAAMIARAGERGQITIATNMAGRGTDIALGEGVAELGGLHVIACERHEASRIDRQLFGRAARQGDPGSCERMMALDDELMRFHLPATLRRLVGALAPSGELPRWLAPALARGAQRHAERERARQRKAVEAADRRMDEMLGFAGREA
jgi:preprotein translocase subunit SecA